MPKDLLKGLDKLRGESDDLPRSRLDMALSDEPEEEDDTDDLRIEGARAIREAASSKDDAALATALEDFFEYCRSSKKKS